MNFVPYIWVKVTEDFKQKKMESGKSGGCWVDVGRVNPHTFTHADKAGGGGLLRVPVIGLGGASRGYLMWRLLSETWIGLKKVNICAIY